MKSRFIATTIMMFLTVGAGAFADVQIFFGLNQKETYPNVAIEAQLAIYSDTSVRKLELGELPKLKGVDIERIPGVNREMRSYNRKPIYGTFYHFKVAADKIGSYTIPPFTLEVDGKEYKTNSVTFTVNEPERGKGVFVVKVKADREKIYIGEDLDLTLQIYVKPYFIRRLSRRLAPLDMLNLIEFSQSKLGMFTQSVKEGLRGNTRININSNIILNDDKGQAQQYYLYEFDTRVSPKSSGELKFDDIQLYIDYPTKIVPVNSLFSDQVKIAESKLIQAKPDQKPIKILPIPTEGRPATFNGAIGKYEIKTSVLPTIVHVGDPITLTIIVTGSGRLDNLPAPELHAVKELTENFKIPSEPMAGVVRGNEKKFVTTIRPRNDDVKCVPAIPLTFFDIQTGKFMTVRSDPRAIMVKPADKLKLKSVVSSNGNGVAKPIAVNMTEAGSGIFANVTDTNELLGNAGGLNGRFKLTLIIAAPAMFVLLGLLKIILSLVSDKAAQRRRAAAKVARARLNKAKTPVDVQDALVGFVADKADKNSAAMTCDEVVAEISGWGKSPEIVASVDGLLKLCEQARYSASSAGEVESLVIRARRCLEELEK